MSEADKTSDKNVRNIEKDIERCEQLTKPEHANWIGISNQLAISNVLAEREKDKKRIHELEEERKRVLDLIFEYGQIDGGHHKMWVIDQIVRILTKDGYNEWIKNYVYDEEIGDIYSWDKGIAP